METVNVIQGTPEWLEHRAKYHNASDAATMLGVSKYKKRDDLIREVATGVVPEIDERTQELFDRGHRFEALARPEAEKIVGEDLSPIVGLKGDYSASFDGITFCESVIFEHKTNNADLRKCKDAYDLHESYRVQMEHQLMVSGADKCLFMASSWDDNDQLIDSVWFWYKSNNELRKKIVAGWDQFKKDVENFKPTETKPEVVGQAVSAELPLPTVVAKGSLVESNLDTILPRFDAYLAEINTELTTDQHFADAAENAKQCRTMAKKLRGVAEAVVAQMASVADVQAVLKQYEAKMDATGLQLEKLVKAEKENIKHNAIAVARDYYNEHVTLINNDLRTVEIPRNMPDFAAAIKGVRTVASMQSRINDALAAGKAEATATANDYKTKLAYINEAIAGNEHLFQVTQLITRDIDHIKLEIENSIAKEDARIAKVKADAEAAAEQKQKAAEVTPEPVKQAGPPVADKPATNNVEDIYKADKSDPHTWAFSDAQAIAFMGTLCQNIDNAKLSDKEFRQVIRQSLVAMADAA